MCVWLSKINVFVKKKKQWNILFLEASLMFVSFSPQDILVRPILSNRGPDKFFKKESSLIFKWVSQ